MKKLIKTIYVFTIINFMFWGLTGLILIALLEQDQTPFQAWEIMASGQQKLVITFFFMFEFFFLHLSLKY